MSTDETQRLINWVRQAKDRLIQHIHAGARPDDEVMANMPPSYQEVWRKQDEDPDDWSGLLDPPKS